MAARTADTARRPRVSVPEPQQALPPLVEAKLSAPRMRRGVIGPPAHPGRARRRRRADARGGAGGLREDDGRPDVVCDPECRVGVGYARRRRRRPQPDVEIRRDGGRSNSLRPRPTGAASTRRPRRPDRASGRRVDERTQRYEAPVILVLDDLHTVTDRDCLASIDHALRHVPENVRVIVGTRIDPSIELARLRAARQLTELRASDLAFTSREAHALLVGHGKIELSDEQIDLLVERTEGWPAALVLAGIWLRGVDDPSSAVAAFGGRPALRRRLPEHRGPRDDSTTTVVPSCKASPCSVSSRRSCATRYSSAPTPPTCSPRSSAPTSSCRDLEHGDWYRMHSLFAEYASAQLECVRSRSVGTHPSAGRELAAGTWPTRSRRSLMRRPQKSTRSSPSCSPTKTLRSFAAARAERSSAGRARCRMTSWSHIPTSRSTRRSRPRS